MKFTMKLTLLTSLFSMMTVMLVGQCETWVGSPKMNDAENAHSIYRQALKIEDWDIAFENWQIAYDIAPAADGKRDYHFTDGAKLYLHKFKNETDAAKKKEYADKYVQFYDLAIACYGDKGISLPCKTDDCYNKRISYLQGRKAFDMFYTLNTSYSLTLAALKDAVDKGGNDVEYIVMDPYATIMVYNFEKGNATKEEARAAYETLNAIADFNIANNAKLAAYYQQAKDAMNAKFRQIENDIFDCEFFKSKLKPQYYADPENPELIKRILGRLTRQGCPETDEFVMEVDKKWKKYATAENAARQAEFEANNPSVAAKKCYDQGDFDCAIKKYDTAIEQETDPEKKASYLFSKASIQFRKLKKYNEARATARKAASLKPNWGRPFMLIGDMYGSSARNCGDHWNQRLAILAAMDKYRYAKSIDTSVAEEANKRLSKYKKSMPSQDEGFMRGMKAGQTVKVGCWIGETVKVAYN